jgi:hypothetical protein
MTEVVQAPRREVHTCHATNCNQRIPPCLFMCLKHWRMVPSEMQKRIWATYRPGQETDKRPSVEYLSATQEAIMFVRQRELAR